MPQEKYDFVESLMLDIQISAKRGKRHDSIARLLVGVL